MDNTYMAFILTIMAGLSTMIGIIPIFWNYKNINKIICGSLALASGVMFSISVLDLLPESFKLLINLNDILKIGIIFISLMIGIIIGFLIDIIINKYKNNSLYNIGIISMLGIIFHNIPEGIITFISTTKDIKLGLSLAIAIALHNIPEGISISVPIYYSTNSKIKAFLYTFISGLSELLGALFTYIFLYNYINNIELGIMLAITAGIMIFISLIELLPNSIKDDDIKLVRLFFIIGIIIVIINIIG